MTLCRIYNEAGFTEAHYEVLARKPGIGAVLLLKRNSGLLAGGFYYSLLHCFQRPDGCYENANRLMNTFKMRTQAVAFAQQLEYELA